MFPGEYVQGFIEGEIAPADFLNILESNPDIYRWLRTMVPPEKKYHMCHAQINANGQNAHVIITVPYDVQVVINHLIELCRGHPWCTYYYIHRELASLWIELFPNDRITISNSIKDRFNMELDLIPRYIGGSDIYKYGIVDAILNDIPMGLSDGDMRSWCQRKVREVFHLENESHPYWRQEASWPTGLHNQPMRFLFQMQKDNVYEYHFADVLTGEEYIVIQESS